MRHMKKPGDPSLEESPGQKPFRFALLRLREPRKRELRK